ncbi:hypothetical protein [Caudoviricetes sp.]|nr:hypothetical protein [Caudoviricetes sp.]
MSLRNWIAKLFAHRHFWSHTAWNGYGVESERTCSTCGVIQHREVSPIGPVGPWVDGESPYAAKLRKEQES